MNELGLAVDNTTTKIKEEERPIVKATIVEEISLLNKPEESSLISEISKGQ